MRDLTGTFLGKWIFHQTHTISLNSKHAERKGPEIINTPADLVLLISLLEHIRPWKACRFLVFPISQNVAFPWVSKMTAEQR